MGKLIRRAATIATVVGIVAGLKKVARANAAAKPARKKKAPRKSAARKRSTRSRSSRSR